MTQRSCGSSLNLSFGIFHIFWIFCSLPALFLLLDVALLDQALLALLHRLRLAPDPHDIVIFALIVIVIVVIIAIVIVIVIGIVIPMIRPVFFRTWSRRLSYTRPPSHRRRSPKKHITHF